ncbi:endo-1,4-beta-xylanase [Aestuariimicrobium soli]|uniref:endo-1,4-beta-xylanase n=1 Tax=Aestuariimicrobium soli TaxID=2035834 RepID=UPI003EB990C3
MTIRPKLPRIAALSAAMLMASALVIGGSSTSSATPPEATLRKAAPIDLKIGSATWGQRDLTPYTTKHPTAYQSLLAAQFSSVTPENDMKWDAIHPAPAVYDFTSADAVVAFAKSNGMSVRGHTLLWHSQNPQWVTDAAQTWTCDEARSVLKDHILTVVGHFRGKIYEWDVANEIFHDTWDEGGVRLRTDQNPFLKACAADPVGLIGDAFRWAHQADPKAALFMNDYAAEGINAKTDAYYALAKQLLAEGVPLGGFGAQAHLDLDYAFDTSLQANFQRFAALGLKVAVTEADVRVRVDSSDQPLDPADVQRQADQYGQLLKACLNVKACSSFTVWQDTDAYSWVPGVFPGKGYATPWTADLQAKPAATTMRSLLEDATPGRSPRRS